MQRRTFLRRAVAVGAAVTGGVGTAAARYQDQPDDVTLSYDREALLRYRPLLDLTGLDPQLRTDMVLFGWVARSEKQQTAAYQYLAWYPFQEGLSSGDSHVPDREPIVVFVDEATDEVQSVAYDGYHYLAAQDADPRRYEITHPYLKVVAPWKPYRRPAASESTDHGEYVELRDMQEVAGSWWRDGWEADRRTILSPWDVRSRGHWWADSAIGRIELLQARLSLEVAQASGGLLSLGDLPTTESELVA